MNFSCSGSSAKERMIAFRRLCKSAAARRRTFLLLLIVERDVEVRYRGLLQACDLLGGEIIHSVQDVSCVHLIVIRDVAVAALESVQVAQEFLFRYVERFNETRVEQDSVAHLQTTGRRLNKTLSI